jgi:hypothetical protein
MDTQYSLEVRDKPGLLIAVMRLLAGDDACISFEGDLSECNFDGVPGTSTEETPALKRATLYPRQDFIVLGLTNDSVRTVLARVVAAGGIVNRIVHIQVEKEGALQFAAYDNFHPECIAVGPAVPKTVLDDLLSKGVLRAIHPVERSINEE